MPENETPPRTAIEVPADPPAAPYGAEGGDGSALNLPLLVVFALILAAVAASNVWLRRRADRQRDGQDSAP